MRWLLLLICTTSLFAQTKDLTIADCTLGKLHARITVEAPAFRRVNAFP
jgi:hypothetical protein